MPRSSKKKTYKLIFLCVVCLATYSKSAVAHWTLNVVICVWETESSSAHTNECIYRFAKESLCVFMLYKWERLKKFSTNLHSTTEHRMNNIFFLHLKQTTTHRESEREGERARTRASKLSATTESKSESLHGRERERDIRKRISEWLRIDDWERRGKEEKKSLELKANFMNCQHFTQIRHHQLSTIFIIRSKSEALRMNKCMRFPYQHTQTPISENLDIFLSNVWHFNLLVC